MDPAWMKYRKAGIAGGLMLMTGNFYGSLCLLQLFAFVPLMITCHKYPKPKAALLTGFYMGLCFTIPQMIYLRMPVIVTVILLLWMTLLLVGLCYLIVKFTTGSMLLSALAIGAAAFIIDWINYTAVPIWGMAQSFTRSWTAYPTAIQFISITGISGVFFVILFLQSLFARWIAVPPSRSKTVTLILSILTIISIINFVCLPDEDLPTLRIGAVGWVFDDRYSDVDPHRPDGFEQLFANPARECAQQGARVVTSGEMGFYIADHEKEKWMSRFAKIARENQIWLVVGYFDMTENQNRIFFMNPDGQILYQYTKTYLTPYEPGTPGNGDLKTVEIDGIPVGAMICQDDNFSKLTRRYGRQKIPILLCPTADWWTIKNAHLQAVPARAIECQYGIVRGAACGISAAISPSGKVLEKMDHYSQGPGYVVADIPMSDRVTFFSRFGHAPMLALSVVLILLMIIAGRQLQRDKT